MRRTAAAVFAGETYTASMGHLDALRLDEQRNWEEDVLRQTIAARILAKDPKAVEEWLVGQLHVQFSGDLEEGQ